VTTIGGIGESKLIELIKPYLSRQAGGDDAAVIDPFDRFQVISTDTAVEGVHFDLTWMEAEDVGWRALALALGDLAAKGASPRWVLASLAVPRGWILEHLIDVFAGMSHLCPFYGMDIEGGDLSATDGPAVISLTVGGYTEKRPLQRSEAQAGWSVGVTGPLGAAAVALRRHEAPLLWPLIADGERLNALGLCCGDISDGLVREMEKFLAMSGIGSTIRANDVPRAPDASVSDALTSGEEVQLVCVGPPGLIAEAGLHVVGEMVGDQRVSVIGAELERPGYDHFA
jgi:thiamine-monophosphate kinase